MVGVRIAFRLEPVSLRPIVCKGRGLQKTDEELNKTGQTSELMTISSVPAISSMQSHFGEHWHLRPPVRSRGERGNPECGHRRCYELNLVEQPKPVPEVSFWLARWQSVPTNSRLWEAGSHEFRQPGVELSFGLLRKLESHLSAGRPAELLQPFLSLQATIDLDGSLAEGSAILLAQPGACERARKRSNWNWDDGESLGVLRHVQKAKLHSVGNVVLKSDAFRSSRVGCSLFS